MQKSQQLTSGYWYGNKSFGGNQEKVSKLLLIYFSLNFPSVYSSLDQQDF